MALDRNLREAVRRLCAIVAKYAKKQGWKKSDYQVLFHLNPDWGQIYIALVVKKLPKKDVEESWYEIIDFLEDNLQDDPPLRDAIHLNLKTFDMVEEGGLYSISPKYVEAGDL